MKKLLVFILILMMVIPVQAFAGISPEEPSEKATGINGMFEILMKTDNQWENAGSLGFGKFQETKEIDLGEYLKEGTNAIIKISQQGGGASYLDAVFLDGMQAVKVNGLKGKVLNKLTKEDLDITPVEDGIILEFSTNKGEGILSVTGRIENEVISQEPLQFPLANNYKHKNQIRDFYNYKLNSNYGKITADGELDEVENLEVFAQEYQVPGSGHPAGDTYFWVMNDDENLYVTMDFTPDNTYDGDKDYAKVYVKTDEGIKEFKVSVPETTWGNAGFTYTDKVVYEHKVYEFAIPLNEISNITDELELAFVGYGTASLPILPDVCLPRLAYDTEHEIYLSVYQKSTDGGSYGSYKIFGQFVYSNVDGTEVVCDEFQISSNDIPGGSQYPDVAYDQKNDMFLVVWSEGNPSIVCRTIKLKSVDKITDSDQVDFDYGTQHTLYSQSEENPSNASLPAVAYDSQEGKLLVVWENYFYVPVTYDTIISIKGMIVDLNESLYNLPVINISIHDYAGDIFSAVCYSEDYKAFLVVWESFDESRMIQGNIVTSIGPNPAPESLADLIVIEQGKGTYSPTVSINNNSNDFLVTWGDETSTIYGAYVDLSDPDPVPEQITPDDSSAYHSTSFYDGTNSMLCLWNDIIADSSMGYIKMKTIGESEIYTPREEYTNNNYRRKEYNLIDSCGNGKGEILVAYGRYIPKYYYRFMSDGEEEVDTSPIGYCFIGKTIPSEPDLEFEKNPYEVELGTTEQTALNLLNFGGIAKQPLESFNGVTFSSSNTNIATISTSGAIKGITVGKTTVSAIYVTGANGSSTTYTAITNVEVYKKSSPGPSPQKTIIGQVIVDGKVLKDIYAEDLVADRGIYSFEASKTGDNAKLWLLESYYKQIADKNPNGVLQLVWDAASYNLPLASKEVLKEVNNISGSKVNIILEKADDEKVIESAAAAVDKLGGKMVSGLIDFNVSVEGKTKVVNIDKYNLYVERKIDQLNKLDAYSTTAMKLLEDDEFTFAPSVFGNNAATIKYRGNGIFAVVNNPKSFSDIAAHWSKMNVEKLAARNIAFGKSDGLFAPNDYITRAEFAVMITRALGITEEEGTVNLEDVQGWYEEDIATAYDAGLINGRGDGKFYPNERIQRKDMAVMIQNALKFAGKGETVKNKDSVLSMFTDSSKIDEYAKESVALCAEAGIIMGRDTKEFDPDENATRAEASAIIERMLKHLEFIN